VAVDHHHHHHQVVALDHYDLGEGRSDIGLGAGVVNLSPPQALQTLRGVWSASDA
jgi:hypothetical protein